MAGEAGLARHGQHVAVGTPEGGILHREPEPDAGDGVRVPDRGVLVAGDLAPLVAEFTGQLLHEGFTGLTVRGFDHAARHLAHWLAAAEIAVADVDEAVVARIARHRCRCPGGRNTKQISGRYVKRARRFVAFLAERGMVRLNTAGAISLPQVDPLYGGWGVLDRLVMVLTGVSSIREVILFPALRERQ